MEGWTSLSITEEASSDQELKMSLQRLVVATSTGVSTPAADDLFCLLEIIHYYLL